MNEISAIVSQANSAQEFSTDLLKVYYGRLFPYDEMFNWLSYGNDPTKENPHAERDYFLRREWSFTIADDVYIRYQSFKDKNEFMAGIQKRQPHKIDIGAVFTASPKDHVTIKPELFKPVERELVFDIDMTDYDDIRTCCTGAAICCKCWPYMTMAMKVVDQALREDFAFKHILWIYSGRRGIHCWVSDEAARQLANDARVAIVGYLSVEHGSTDKDDKRVKKIFEGDIHPMIKRAYSTLEPFFETCICDEEGQGLLANIQSYRPLLNSLPNDGIRTMLDEEWKRNVHQSGSERWRQLKNAITAPTHNNPTHAQKKTKINYSELDTWRYELVFKHCYPRLDIEVSKSRNHLLKSPFCVHPKTGRVCVPIDPAAAEDFNPFTVPTVKTLCAQIDEYDKNNPDAKDKSDSEKTSLHDAIEVFKRTFWNDLSTSIRRDFRDRADRHAAMAVDF